MRNLLFLILIVAISGSASAGDNGKNTCYTEDVEVRKGTSFAVTVILDNVDSLIALQLPIFYRSEEIDLVCDSVTYGGTRLGGESLVFSKIEPVGKVVFFAYMSMIQLNATKTMLNPGKGPIANLWFTAGKDIKSGKVTLDSGPHAYYPHEWIDYSYHFWARSEGDDITADVDCEFKQSHITIK